MGCFLRIVFQRVLFVWFNAPNGIQSMSADLEGLVESSLNLGIISTVGDTVALRYSVRSSVKSLKWYISDKLEYLTEMMGGDYSFEGEYPEWEYKKIHLCVPLHRMFLNPCMERHLNWKQFMPDLSAVCFTRKSRNWI